MPLVELFPCREALGHHLLRALHHGAQTSAAVVLRRPRLPLTVPVVLELEDLGAQFCPCDPEVSPRVRRDQGDHNLGRAQREVVLDHHQEPGQLALPWGLHPQEASVPTF